jgi:fructosamine-3-kinase
MNVQEQLLREKIDPALTAENLSLLSTRALEEPVRAESARILTGGCWNRVISVGFEDDTPDLVFKINPGTGDDRLKREYRVLEYFSHQTEMPVPEPLLLDATGQIIPGSVLVMRRLPGIVLHQAYSYLGSRDQLSISDQVGHFVGKLHISRSRLFGGVELPQPERISEWKDFWLPRFDAVFEDISHRDLVDVSFLDAIGEARKAFPDYLDIGSESTLTHYDIWSGNVMVDANGRFGQHSDSGVQVSGFLDIPGFWADYARELSFMEMFGMADTRFYDVYTSYHRLDEAYEIRKNLYNLKMHLKHITMYPDQNYYRDGARHCLSFIQSQ